jgi:hypothetical protein
MFNFRINQLIIRRNREFGKAEVKLLSFINTDNMELPDFSDYLHSNDKAYKKRLLRTAVAQVVESRQLTEISKVRDNHVMTFGSHGYNLLSSSSVPENFDWQFIAYESDRKEREVASLVDEVLGHQKYAGFERGLESILRYAVNTNFTAVKAIAGFAVEVVKKLAKKNRDDLIGILYTSLNRYEHYPDLEMEVAEMEDLTKNMLISYSLFGRPADGEEPVA